MGVNYRDCGAYLPVRMRLMYTMYILRLNHQVAHLKYIQFLMINYTSMDLGNKAEWGPLAGEPTFSHRDPAVQNSFYFKDQPVSEPNNPVNSSV